MDTQFKTDAEYGWQISLADDREVVEGHNLGFNKTDTEVTAIQKILDAYIDTTSLESIARFASYKLDFSVSFLDSICIVLSEKIQEANDLFTELEKQMEDINHQITKPYLTGTPFTSEEKIELFDTQQELLNRRRDIKDTIMALKVTLENTEKSRNFILGMNRRKYSPKSAQYKDDPDYQYDSKSGYSRTCVSVSLQRDTNQNV